MRQYGPSVEATATSDGSSTIWSSTDRLRLRLADAADGDQVPYPKEITAATMLWDLEVTVACNEPILIGTIDAHRNLLSFRSRM